MLAVRRGRVDPHTVRTMFNAAGSRSSDALRLAQAQLDSLERGGYLVRNEVQGSYHPTAKGLELVYQLRQRFGA